MKKTYYLFNPGRLSRKENTLQFISVDEDGKEQPAKYIPVEGISDLYIFGSLDANSALYNFLGKNQIQVHFFDYYENYSGSFMPRERLLAGKMIIAQSQHYLENDKRILLAKKILEAAVANMIKNLRYYYNRQKELDAELDTIEGWHQKIFEAKSIEELMGIEGHIRHLYYRGFNIILSDFEMNKRSKQPPENEVNALISFGNMMCYTTCLKAIYQTQLNPTISFLHEPGVRRYSLALDLAEIFKPILVDRVIFKLLNKKMLSGDDFDQKLNYCLLKDCGKKIFIRIYEERLHETIQHRTLKKKVSYEHLIKLECYKLGKHLLGMQPYQPLKMWW